MLHACVERFDMMGERGNILGWDGEVNEAQVIMLQSDSVSDLNPIKLARL
jgi:hypothetical protein